MEESNRDIQCLIKLKKQRPAFSRMIFWEMSQATDTQYGKKVKQKKKQKCKDGANQENADGDIDDVNEETDSGSAASSDYETDNEDMVDELELSGAISSINTGTSFDTADVAMEEDLDSEDDDDEEEEDDPFETIATEPASGDMQPVRRRRLSKRQKRKRSKLFRVTYIDEFANLAGLYNFDEDIKTAITDVSENAGSLDICCPVPTLAELCLKATRQRRKRNQSGQRTSTSTPLPIGIKRIIKDWRFHQETLDKQLSFFLNFVLPSCCDKKDIKLSNVYHCTADKHEFNFPVRSVWSSAAHPTNKDCGFQYPSERATAFLYNPTMRCLSKDISGSLSSYTDIDIYDNLYPSSTHVQSALATTIDLMLPSTLSDRVRHRSCSTDSEVIENASKTAVIRVKRALWSSLTMAVSKGATKHDVSNKIKYTALKTKDTDDEHKVDMSEDISLLENMENVRLNDDTMDTTENETTSITNGDTKSVNKVSENGKKVVLIDSGAGDQDKPVCDNEKDNSVTTKVKEEQQESSNGSENTDADTNLDIVRKMSQARPKQEVRWRQIGSYTELKQKACQRIYAKSGREDDLALFYVNGMFHIMDAWCSHMGGPLFEGDIEDYNGRCHVMCPWHSYMFDLQTGMNEIGLQQNVYELKLENAQVYARYKSDLSTMPCRKQSEARRVIQPPNKNASKSDKPARKDSVLENVMRL